MRVAYVLGTSTGGTVRHVRMLADGLTRRGVTVDVYAPAVTWTPGGPAGAHVGNGEGPRFTAVEIADRPRPAQDLAAVRRLRALLAGTRPDAVHAHGLRAGALAALAASRRGARPRLIVTVHNAAPQAGAAAAVYRLLERLVAYRADQVLCVSSDLEERMRGLGAHGVARALVPAPPAPAAPPDQAVIARLRTDLGAGGPGRVPIVLVVARLAAQKGLGTLVEAAGRWRDRDPAPLLVFAGEGPLREPLARQAAAAGVTARFLGQRGDVPALLAAADVVVLPSVWEGQPLILQETLRAGRPLVASRAGGIPDLTGPDGALLVPPGDAATLAAAVLSVLDDPALAARLGEAAVKQAAQLPSEQDATDAALAAISPGFHR
ncbi:MAG TPA: glycosyltransferase family 4 protein [Streptosporangiaceae bacterium]|jgi:glycosyltransferase involved in cell wall biosynthesis